MIETFTNMRGRGVQRFELHGSYKEAHKQMRRMARAAKKNGNILEYVAVRAPKAKTWIVMANYSSQGVNSSAETASISS